MLFFKEILVGWPSPLEMTHISERGIYKDMHSPLDMTRIL